MNDQEFQFTFINGRKIIARRFILEALLKAHAEIEAHGIQIATHKGFLLSDETTGSWRSLELQRQLVAKGVSKTLLSNHRRGTAVDCYPDVPYIDLIAPIMRKHGFDNDLRPWDKDHFQWKSNVIASSYPIVDQLPSILKEYSDMELDNHVLQLTEQGAPESGSFALVYGGSKHMVSKARLAEAAMTVLMRGMVPTAVNKATWDSVPTGVGF